MDPILKCVLHHSVWTHPWSPVLFFFNSQTVWRSHRSKRKPSTLGYSTIFCLISVVSIYPLITYYATALLYVVIFFLLFWLDFFPCPLGGAHGLPCFVKAWSLKQEWCADHMWTWKMETISGWTEYSCLKKKQNKNKGRQIKNILTKMCLHNSHTYKT